MEKFFLKRHLNKLNVCKIKKKWNQVKAVYIFDMYFLLLTQTILLYKDTRYFHTIARAFFSKLKAHLKQEKTQCLSTLWFSRAKQRFLKKKNFSKCFHEKTQVLGIPNKPYQFKSFINTKTRKTQLKITTNGMRTCVKFLISYFMRSGVNKQRKK